jgi:Carbohydrate binding domain (family 25)
MRAAESTATPALFTQPVAVGAPHRTLDKAPPRPVTSPRTASTVPATMAPPQYVEIFHSKPSWQPAYIQRRDASSRTGWAAPRAVDAMSDAAHIREKFRVYRLDLAEVPGGRLAFTVTDGSDRDWDGPPENPRGWYEIAEGGRYVVEHGLRRVGDVGEECERVMRFPGDKFVQVAFVAELWERCFFAYQPDGGKWVEKPGVEMALAEGCKERKFEVTVEAKGCVFALNNGGEGENEVWDSNHGQNVRAVKCFVTARSAILRPQI